MNFLLVNQSIVDMCASFMALLTGFVDVDVTRMSHNSIYDWLICHLWIARFVIWDLLFTSTYSILLTALTRYAAVIYPIWYNNNVSSIKHRNKRILLH